MEEWYVIVSKTQNGLRIAISLDYPEDALEGPMSEEEAVRACKRWSEQLQISEFNSNVDMWIGGVMQ